MSTNKMLIRRFLQFRLSRNRPASVSLLGLMQILPEVTFQEHR